MSDVRGHVWFSTASDETALPLAERLQYPKGRKAPSFLDCDILVNWGCRARSDWSPKEMEARITEGHLRVLNHPARASEARNKLDMLKRLRDAHVGTPGFGSLVEHEGSGERLKFVEMKLKAGEVHWPLLGLNATNRGQPAFCYNYDELVHTLKNASSEKPIDYVRTLIEGTEYRVHVFRDTVLAAQKKIMSADPVGTVAASLQKKVERQRARAADGDEKPVAKSLKTGDVKDLVGYLAEELLLGPTHYQRTLGRGCELENVPGDQLPAEVGAQAVRAVDALHLDMGAVHVIENGSAKQAKVYLVTNVITNPGLGGGLLESYACAIEEFAGGKGQEKQIPKPSEDDKARPELVAALHRKVDSLSAADLERILGALQ